MASENEGLRTMVNSLKKKVRSLAVEIERVAQFDVLVSEKDDLLVSLSLEKARRLEVEDELSAYKRALREFAEQASSVFCLWLGAYLLLICD